MSSISPWSRRDCFLLQGNGYGLQLPEVKLTFQCKEVTFIFRRVSINAFQKCAKIISLCHLQDHFIRIAIFSSTLLSLTVFFLSMQHLLAQFCCRCLLEFKRIPFAKLSLIIVFKILYAWCLSVNESGYGNRSRWKHTTFRVKVILVISVFGVAPKEDHYRNFLSLVLK